MPVLMNIHFGVHYFLKTIPPVNGLQNLNGLSLALLSSIITLPDFSQLSKLQRLEIVTMESLMQLPNLPENVELTQFVVMLSSLCCNGFLGNCDNSLPACIGADSNSCLPSYFAKQALSDGTQKQISAHSTTICTADELYRSVPMMVFYASPAKDLVDVCDGVLYRECTYDSSGGWSVGHSICNNDRLQVIQCIYSDEAIRLRRREISGGIGRKCDPAEEAWLGCRSDQIQHERYTKV